MPITLTSGLLIQLIKYKRRAYNSAPSSLESIYYSLVYCNILKNMLDYTVIMENKSERHLSCHITNINSYKLYRDPIDRPIIKSNLEDTVGQEKYKQRKCSGQNPNFWFYNPVSGIRSVKDYRAIAIALCQRCLIRQDCLDCGIDNNEHGIWGGFDLDIMRQALKQDGV